MFGVQSLFARQNLQGKSTFEKQNGKRKLTMQQQLQRKLNENAKTIGKKLRKKTPSKMLKSNLSEFEDWHSKTRNGKKDSISSFTTKVTDDLGLTRTG